VVDNCAPELHRRLSEICRRQGSTVSIITVEYDIREDEPEGTEVFELLPSSVELVEQLIKRRFPDLSVIDARTAAEFSGGNPRIAIALAATVGRNESLSGLADRELFQRLFQQRDEYDGGLLQAAQACALVYSFEGEALTGDDAELPRLAALIGFDAAALFRSVSELLRRDLAQRRGVWRAVLPHATANRLAATALQDIPFTAIEAQLINRAPARLLNSAGGLVISRPVPRLSPSQQPGSHRAACSVRSVTSTISAVPCSTISLRLRRRRRWRQSSGR
jgi:hypothetical protein